MYYSVQVQEIENSYSKYGVDRSLIEPILNFDSSKKIFVDSYCTSYDQKKRLSKLQLINKFSKEIKCAQKAYLSSVNAAHELLIRNVQSCERMDGVLGTLISISIRMHSILYQLL